MSNPLRSGLAFHIGSIPFVTLPGHGVRHGSAKSDILVPRAHSSFDLSSNQCDFFGKRVLSVIEDLLHKVKEEYPNVTQAYFRSDNAGCYKSGPLLLSLKKVGERTGVIPVRNDFSAPQAGKDICDRKAASMKAHIKRWVNEKHDVVTAEDMKAALESHGGIKGCRAAVVKVDTTKESNKDNKIPGISVLYNLQYEENGIRVWKAYNIGPGRLIPFNDLIVVQQGETRLKMIQPFGQAALRGRVGESVRRKSEIYSCQETGCILTFKTQAEADDHMDTGKHRLEVDCESIYDRIRRKWAGVVTGVTFAVDVPSTSAHAQEGSAIGPATTDARRRGWALKTTKRFSRMSEKVKAFLEFKFEEGARTAAQRQRGMEGVLEEDTEAAESEMALKDLRSLVMNDMESPNHPVIVHGHNRTCQDCGRRVVAPGVVLAKLGYKQMLEEGVGVVPTLQTSSASHKNQGGSVLIEGWALRSTKKSYRFNEKQKAYLLAKFQIGQATGRKANADAVAREMRRAHGKDGVRLFPVSEFLTAQQIASYFSRLAATVRQQTPSELDILAGEEEQNFETARDTILSSMNLQHPITYDHYNVCAMVEDDTMKSQKLPFLQLMCQSLGLDVPQPPVRRKAPYLSLLKEV
ncbi:hypothetical protein QZH41_007176, partial [Actinostola sp. cb2023]